MLSTFISIGFYCGGNNMGKKRWNTQNVKEFIENNSYCTLMENEYLGYNIKMKFKCRCGNEFYTTWKKFTTKTNPKRQCQECTNKKLSKMFKSDYDKVKKFVEVKSKSGCKLLSKIYTNAKTKMKFKCSCGNIFYTTMDEFKRQHRRRCYRCSLMSKSGENSYRYNPNITEKEREHRRYKLDGIGGYNWTVSVYKKDHYTCQCCGKHQHKLIAHHLDGYNWCKEKRFDIGNGVTLCPSCHRKFHHIYGYGNNTKKQFEEFIKNSHANTEVKHILKDVAHCNA